MLGNYLQQTTSADDIFRCFFFLGALSFSRILQYNYFVLFAWHGPIVFVICGWDYGGARGGVFGILAPEPSVPLCYASESLFYR